MAYKFRYIDKIRTPINGELLRGDAYHKAVAHAYTGIIIYKEKPGIDEVIQVYTDTWNKRLNDRIIIDEGEELSIPSVDFKGKDSGKMKDDGETLLKIYYNTILPKIIPAEVEIRKTTIYEGIPLIAYVDLIDWGGVVIDHKVKARMFSEAELQKDLQSSVYGLILGMNELELHFHTALTVKEPHIEIVPIKRTRDDMDWVGKLIVSAWRQIETGIFSPSPAGWWCSPDQCPFWGHCHIPRSF
uniref:Putative PD-(D/E)XK nuclease superfamily protein n=1 Tax=viral metagenome TaxID=1070528 RepID=A0A6M3M8Z2_9ZZZZ